MKFFSIQTLTRALSLTILAVILSTFLIAADEIGWRPVTQAELDMKKPVVEPDADAEAIFWEITLDDKKTTKLIYRHYVRVKIFTERGREKFAKLDIPFTKGRLIEGVAARVIKPDGTIVLLQSSDIFEREIIKLNKRKILAKSFAVPGIEPGVIVEYQYSETIKNDSASGERLSFQRDIPMQRVTYKIRPTPGRSLYARSYNIPAGIKSLAFSDDPDNKEFQVASMTNVPAIKEEPFMPPEEEVRRWGYLYYASMFTPGWGDLARVWGAYLDSFTKQSSEIKQKAAQLTAGASTPNEKLANIYTFVQKNIRNLSFDKTLTDDQREKLTFKTAGDVLKRGMGSSLDIDLLFATLANAAGFDIAIVGAADRGDYFFSPEKYPYLSFLAAGGAAVRMGNDWKIARPGLPYLPFGGIPWTEEGMPAMIVTTGGHFWKDIPIADPMASPVKRTAKLNLLEDGTIEGSVKLEYEGHPAVIRREEGLDSSPQKREDDIRDEIKKRMSAVEITSLSIENFDEPSKTLTYIFNVRVPGYAAKTGKRLFLQPAFFEFGKNPLFTASTRVYPICFPYPWSEQDSVEIQLPKGYVLDSPDAPGSVSDPSKIGSLENTITINNSTGLLKYKRNFYFGKDGKITFPAEFYTPIKALFDEFHKSDTHALTIRQAP